MADGLSSPTTQNIYYLSQKLNELQLKEAKLQQKLAMNKLKQQIRRVDGIMSLNLQAESETLQTTCTITENLTKLEKIISGNKNIIPVTREKHREVQQLLAASTNILNQTASNINNEECSNLNLNTSLENIKTLTTKYEKTNTALDNYMQLYKMINCIISIGEKNSLQADYAHKPRTRRSRLSDSSFLTTFEANNISTSSQLEETIKPHLHHMK